MSSGILVKNMDVHGLLFVCPFSYLAMVSETLGSKMFLLRLHIVF